MSRIGAILHCFAAINQSDVASHTLFLFVFHFFLNSYIAAYLRVWQPFVIVVVLLGDIKLKCQNWINLPLKNLTYLYQTC